MTARSRCANAPGAHASAPGPYRQQRRAQPAAPERPCLAISSAASESTPVGPVARLLPASLGSGSALLAPPCSVPCGVVPRGPAVSTGRAWLPAQRSLPASPRPHPAGCACHARQPAVQSRLRAAPQAGVDRCDRARALEPSARVAAELRASAPHSAPVPRLTRPRTVVARGPLPLHAAPRPPRVCAP